MEQKLEQQTHRQQSDLVVIQKQIEAIQVQQLKQDEQITEAKGNIVDVRAWQTTMGQKFIETQSTLTVIHLIFRPPLISILLCKSFKSN